MIYQKRETGGGYHGKREGLTAMQAVVLVLVILSGTIGVVLKQAEAWTGMEPEEQIYVALIEAKDWE